MNRIEDFPEPRRARPTLLPLVAAILMWAAWPVNLPADEAPQAPPTPASNYTSQSPEQLDQLVAPIALYPDSLVAQILAASTFPEQIVVAERWMQANPDLKDQALAQAADQQPWDPSVKALVAFPTVLGNLDKNLSWTSSLGDAYYNQQPDVLQAVQVMRQRAQAAGNLNTTPQQTVETEGSTIVVQPASPEVVYVPAYDPWVVYGAPVLAWPDWYGYPGIWLDGPSLSFGIGFGIGFFGGFGWGWGHWGFDWHGGYSTFDHGRYYSRSNTFYNRNAYYRGGGARGVATRVARGGGADRARSGAHGVGGDRAGSAARGGNVERSAAGHDGSRATGDAFAGRPDAARGYAAPEGESGVRSGALSGYDHGGQTRAFSSRGSSSFTGGGAGAHGGGGGGGAHGGGGGGGGHSGGGRPH
jgi:hypothetical protein